MEIKTKYNIGDTVYYLSDNTVKCSTIEFITIYINNYKNSVTITYTVRDYNSYNYITKEELFPTKEELLKSL